ncbi:MAG: hypothetical protein CM1200mP1_13250 [Candidatus Neomarinimicrobiota bacterium]|nr:MAG: hypothetical protein CM1200mP1_13250 [Candidatus Neomarinimicrobiota bacterium]
MDQPLGKTAGMWCEINESIEALKGNASQDLMDVVFELGSKLIVQRLEFQIVTLQLSRFRKI